ncbi:STM4014 family protein [Streptomyces sp. 5-8]|uniref:STM4014 family protein n=1 Tax=Streptomyces musisoli TaxID=2802280 RepID=A0ABS1NW11_9ACTN|nr:MULTISPECIES: STM4014 family protein [Streptomyces]MBL1104300.1 STM4014 family protein [Streptomyces musisoli]MBY8844457.1 STM4014 family protein [Streptomyces sp. SP2-10]
MFPRHDDPGAHRTGTARFAVVGNPENRRVALFDRAVRAAGLPAPRVVPWAHVLRTGGAGFAGDELVRLDSPGENAEVDRLLRGAEDPTRVEGSGRWYASLMSALRGLRGGIRLDDTDELAVLFDKRRCHAVLAGADVPVPDSPTSGADAAPVRGWADVRALMREHRMPRLFVKPAHGSSASGVLAIESAGGGRIRATTSVELVPEGRLFNSLRVRRYHDERQIAAIVDTLAPDGLHLERWLPKGSQRGRAADLRVVVVAGRATHAVVRTSASPLTNLHLGGRRGDLDVARAAVESAGARWTDVLGVCERAAACFPRTLCVGVDLLPAVGWRRVAVGEVNAFGDLLPRLTGLPGSGAEGLDTYAAQVAAALARHTPPHHPHDQHHPHHPHENETGTAHALA